MTVGEFNDFKILFDKGLLRRGGHLNYTEESLKKFMINLGTKKDGSGQPAHLSFIDDKSYRDGIMEKIVEKINAGVIGDLADLGEFGNPDFESMFS